MNPEDKTTITDYKLLHEQNAVIHTFMGRQPEEEYVVSTIDETGTCLHPKFHGCDAWEQKKICDDWVKQNGTGQYKTRQNLNYPYYHQHWNELMPVVEKLNKLLDEGHLNGLDIDLFRSMQNWITSVNIKCAYLDAVAIIRWYNSTQNKEQS